MNSERWAQIKAVLADAMDLPVDRRTAFLDEQCGTDRALRQEVESLLAAADGTDSLPGARDAIAASAMSAVAEQESAHRSFLESVLGRQYEILRPIGRGGMSDVYLARERALERFVAIKVLRPELALAPASRERFRREARIVAQFTHPGILRLHTFGEVGGVWYFVMGYVRGESLAERLHFERRLFWVDTLRILTDVADALDHAHRHGVIHRDIKPANILLDDESGHAVLADFGISKVAGGESLTASGAVVGTPDYMSPEQIDSSDVDERSDIYSLGAVAYRMLAGQEPFVGGSTSEVMYRRLSHDAAPLQSLAPLVPEALTAVVMKCLARKPAERWESAQALRQALGRVAGSGAEALPEGVRDLPTFGPYALLWAAAWIAVAAATVRPPNEFALLLLIAFLVPIGLILHVWNGGRHGLSPMELARVALWPPEWWGMWWPRSLRRPADLWSRLPWQARLARSALSGFFVAIPAIIILKHWLGVTGRVTSDDPAHQWFALAEAVVVLGAAAVTIGGLVWARGQSLSLGESFRVLFGPTSASSYWELPRMVSLLTPVPGRVRSPIPDYPPDHQRAIRDVVLLLPTQAHDTGVAAAAMGERVLRVIEQRDLELVSLDRVANATEVDRLGAQLASLGDESAGESSERHELRQLLRHQLDVVARVRGRRELIAQQRAQLFDALRGLWSHLRDICDALDDPKLLAESTQRVRSLCAEIGAELERSGADPIQTISSLSTGRPASVPASRPIAPS